MTLGSKRVSVEQDKTLLHSPNDVVVDPIDGDIFVADSHRRD
jgi:sugar lactone lactonase YvrE